MQVHIGVVKTPKWASPESGDTVEVVERRQGGVTVVLADGQGSGPAAKRISTLVVSRAVALIADGARDGAVARAVHDLLYAHREGRVSAALCMLSVDLSTRTLVISRNGDAVVVVRTAADVEVLGRTERPIGVYRRTRPQIAEYPLAPGLLALAVSDGVTEAGRRHGCQVQLSELEAVVEGAAAEDAEGLAGRVLELAVERDEGRPADDMSVVVVGLDPASPDRPVRKLTVAFPV